MVGMVDLSLLGLRHGGMHRRERGCSDCSGGRESELDLNFLKTFQSVQSVHILQQSGPGEGFLVITVKILTRRDPEDLRESQVILDAVLDAVVARTAALQGAIDDVCGHAKASEPALGLVPLRRSPLANHHCAVRERQWRGK